MSPIEAEKEGEAGHHAALQRLETTLKLLRGYGQICTVPYTPPELPPAVALQRIFGGSGLIPIGGSSSAAGGNSAGAQGSVLPLLMNVVRRAKSAAAAKRGGTDGDAQANGGGSASCECVCCVSVGCCHE